MTSVFRPGWARSSSGTRFGRFRRWAGRRRRTELSWLTDQRISYQQAVSKFAIALVVLVARRNKIEFLVRLLPELRLVLPSVKPGQVRRVGG